MNFYFLKAKVHMVKGGFFMESKRLYKSNTNKIICGVCGGIGEYFGIDPTLIRLALVLFSFTGSSIVAYIVAAIIMPSKKW